MKWLQIVGLAVALFLVFHPDLFVLVGGAPQFGNPLGDMDSADRLTVLFWSAVVFLYFLIRFRTWAADPPPLEFAHTPPRHCTTRSRYLVAQAAYAGLLLAVFWLLVAVPQLIDLLRQALTLADQASLVPAAFSDQELEKAKEVASQVAVWRELKPVEAAPYVTMLLLLYPRFELLRERGLRRYFQERALIPKEARDHINEIGDGRDRKRFNPDRAVLEHLGDGALKGLIDTSRYPDEQDMHDIILAEYLFDGIERETKPASIRARRDSDFAEISDALKGARTALGEFVLDARELISALEADEVRAVQDWKVLTARSIETLLAQTAEFVSAPAQPDARSEADWSLRIDRVRQDIKDLRPHLAAGPDHLAPLRTLLVIDNNASAIVESMRGGLRDLVGDRRNLLQPLRSLPERNHPMPAGDLAVLLEEFEHVRAQGATLLRAIDDALSAAAGERVTLDWIESYREILHGTKLRVFARAFDTRKRELMDRYKLLRQQLIRLMTTLVLASDPSMDKRAKHFRGFGFELPQKKDRKIPRNSLWLTFVVVFILCLITSFTYLTQYDGFVETAGGLFGTSLPDLFGTVQASGWTADLRIETPGRAVFWAFISAMMQMMAVWLALAAWILSPDYQAPTEDEPTHVSTLLSMWFTGLVFGFVGGVLAFYLVGLMFGYPTMLRQSWAWTLLGGITGAFLLVQGINVRRGAWRATNITAVAQGISSGIAALLIAWVWGHGHVQPVALAAFALYAGSNLLLVGTALGLLARYFMRVDDVMQPVATSPEGSSAASPVA